MTSTNIEAIRNQYDPRASKYDSEHDAWHARLAADFVEWSAPQPGEAVLDLACGTGLVTFLLADRVAGRDGGVVIGVDVTKGMLDVAEEKLQNRKRATRVEVDIEFAEGDIMSPDLVGRCPKMKTVIEERGGFDLITVCSALVLLPNPGAAMKMWKGWLKPGGRIIVDVISNEHNVPYWFSQLLPERLGLTVDWDRSWVKGLHSVERLLLDAGLEIERSWKTQSQWQEKYYLENQMMEVFDDNIDKYDTIIKAGKRDAARVEWKSLWAEMVNRDGLVEDGLWLYILIGRK